jgi:tetratricopeptide (TPR) repeat protein
VAKAHLAAAGIAFWQGDYDAAHRQSQKGLAVSQALDDRPGVAEATYNLAFVSPAVGLAAGELDWLPESIKQLRDAMTRFEELDDRAGVAKSKGAMALFLAGVGDFESARPLFEEAIAGCRDLGDMFHLANILGEYGYGLQMLGHHQEARAPILESLGLFHRAGNLMGVGLALEALAALELAEGRHERAIRLLGSAREIGRSTEGGYPIRATSVVGIDALAKARDLIGDDAVDQALAMGRSMSLVDAVALATETR